MTTVKFIIHTEHVRNPELTVKTIAEFIQMVVGYVEIEKVKGEE